MKLITRILKSLILTFGTIYFLQVNSVYSQTPRFSELECVANAQAIALDFGKQELNKQLTINYSRGLAMDFHRWLVKTSKTINSKAKIEKYNHRVSDYRLDSYNRRFVRVGYCMSWYLNE